jgi:hypothetical protein
MERGICRARGRGQAGGTILEPGGEVRRLVSQRQLLRGAADWGVPTSFDAASAWAVTHDSYLSKLELAQGAKVEAREGYSLSMTINGKPTAIKAGSYSGKIVIAVKKL